MGGGYPKTEPGGKRDYVEKRSRLGKKARTEREPNRRKP